MGGREAGRQGPPPAQDYKTVAPTLRRANGDRPSPDWRPATPKEGLVLSSRSRLVSILGLLLLLLVLPGTGLAGSPTAGPYGQAHVGPNVAVVGPTILPGVSVVSVGFGDSGTFDTAGGATLVWQNAGGFLSTYSSAASGVVTAAPRLPAGATLWQVDAYGYSAGATTHGVLLDDASSFGSAIATVANQTSTVGPGLVQTTMSFPSGVSLAPGHAWFLSDFTSTSASSAFIGAIFQYTLATTALVPIAPARIFDSRFATFGGKLGAGTHRTIDVKDAIDVTTGVVNLVDAIPQGAKAVSFNVTVTQTVGGGYLAIVPGAGTTVTASTLNWAGSGVTIANGGLIALGSGAAERQITLILVGHAGNSAHVIVDITGYYW